MFIVRDFPSILLNTTRAAAQQCRLRRTQAQHIREKDAVSERVSARSAKSPLGVPFKTVLASNMQAKQRARGSGQQPQPPPALNRAEISRWTSRCPSPSRRLIFAGRNWDK
jgi:hypothetical protein